MTPFSACLSTLCLNHAEAAELLGCGVGTIKQAASGQRPAKPWMFEKLADLFELVEREADDIIADQGEKDGGAGFAMHEVDISKIPLPHPALRAAAFARAMMTLGPELLVEISEPSIVIAAVDAASADYAHHVVLQFQASDIIAVADVREVKINRKVADHGHTPWFFVVGLDEVAAGTLSFRNEKRDHITLTIAEAVQILSSDG